MRVYIITSAVVFMLVVVAHVARLAVEGSAIALQPGFVATTGLALAMSGWALWLLRTRRR